MIKSILVGIDFTEADGTVLEWAKVQARAFDAELHLVHVYPGETSGVGYAVYVYPGEDARQEELRAEKDRLRVLVEAVRSEGLRARAFMKESSPAEGLLAFAAEHEEALLVLGTHSRPLLERALMGSTAAQVLKGSRRPVLVVPTGV